jgi:hypothetical protein
MLAGQVQLAGPVGGDAEVPQRLGGGGRGRVAGLPGQGEGAFQDRGGRGVVAALHLVEAAGPEESLGFAAGVADSLVELSGALEQGKGPRVGFGVVRVAVPLRQEAAVDQAAAG